MTDFVPLLAAIRRVFPTAQLEPLTEPELAAIRKQYPDVPEHYLELLRHVGWGSLGGNFMLYGGPIEPGEIFDTRTAADLTGIVFFGDNFSGDMYGFDTRDGWRLVLVDSASPKPWPEEARTVAEFIAQYFLNCEED
jgi:hypothetical protein